ncbi:PTS ascorbate transporter subunit IIC [Corynebacterium diphtheriae]|nr:PTS ascorbate transporter subunit IIC [Corynebacterium diphtheriae]
MSGGGVYGNVTGGRRGAALGGLTNGLIITFLPAFPLGVLGNFGDTNTTFGDADFGWFGMLVGGGARVGGPLGIVLVILVGLAVFALGWFSQVKLVQGNWDPTPWRGGSATAGAAGAAAGSAQGLPRIYPKVLPPKGAPVPPSR